MPEPNPVWGVHVVPGAVTAALVRRTESGGYEVLEALAERAPDDAAGAVDAARAVLRRRGVGARGAIVALPDTAGCLVTATIPPEELDLSDHEISNEMYEWTPFEPDQAELRHVCVLREGRRQERIVTALPRTDYRRCLEILEKGDLSRLGVAFAGAATWRGALAMGLVPPDGFLVATLPDVTEIYAWPQGRVRRHVLPVGAGDIARDATAIDLLARDLAQLSDYHRALRRRDERPPAEPRFALAGLAAASPGVRQRLAAVLGPRLDESSPGERAVVVAPRARVPDVPIAAFAGAVGAAMEGLRPAEQRLVLRHVPANLPPYRERSRLAISAALAVVAAAGGAVALHLHGGGATPQEPSVGARTPAPETNVVPTAPSEALAKPAVREDAAPEPPPPPPPAETPAVAAEPAGDARVRVRWPAGAANRTLRRTYLGRDGGEPRADPVDVRAVGAESGEIVDDVAGPDGVYEYSLEGADPSRAGVDVPVEVELLGPDGAIGARFALRRPWRGASATMEVRVALDGRVAGAQGELVFESAWTLRSVVARTESESTLVSVPEFLPDGRIDRDAEGAPRTRERVVERTRLVFQADCVGRDGARRTWLRKMTDG
jgi:hypothetical protein